MLRIRLQRKGRKKRPIWHIVVADSRSPRDGRIIERVGRYDNVTENKEVVYNEDRIMYWLDSGAQPSDTVRKILRREGILYKRHLMNWGKSEEEIEKALAEWKDYRDSKDDGKATRKEQMKQTLAAEEKEFKKQVQEKAAKAAAEVEAEKAAREQEKAEAEAEAAEAETEEEAATAPAEEAAEAVEENIAEATEEPEVEEAQEEAEAETAEETEEEAEEETKADDSEEKAEAEEAEESSDDEEKEEETEEAKSDDASGENVSTAMTAKEAIDHINDTDLADLEGFVPEDEDRVTVQRAWETKQEEG